MSRRNRLCRLRNPKANVIRILYRSLQGTPFERPAAGRRSQAADRGGKSLVMGRTPQTPAAPAPLRRGAESLTCEGEGDRKAVEGFFPSERPLA